MKRIIALTLTALMLLTFAACGEKGPPPEVGFYVIESMTDGGETYKADVLAEYGIVYTLALNEDGTFVLTTDEKITGTWKNGQVNYKEDGEDVYNKFTYKDDTITFVLDEATNMVFKRSDPSAAATTTAAATTVPAAVAYSDTPEGFFILESMGNSGEVISGQQMRDMGMAYTLQFFDDGMFEFTTFFDPQGGILEDGMMTYVEFGEAVTCPYTYTGDTFAFSVPEDDGDETEFVFIRSNDTPPARTIFEFDPTGGWGDFDATGGTGYMDWWQGDWYGDWYIESASGIYEDDEGDAYDIYAVVEIDYSGTATVYIWNDYFEMGTIELELDPDYGSGYMGGAISTGGTFLDGSVERGDWIIRPGTDGFDDTCLYIEAQHEDDDDSDNRIWYTLLMRPWGADWDDIEWVDRPLGYDDWYMQDGRRWGNMIEELMSDSFDDGTPLFVHPAVSGGSVARRELSGVIKGSIVGEFTDDGGSFGYTFESDGTGIYDMAGYDMEFTYEIDGNLLLITYGSNTYAEENEFELDQNSLIIRGPFSGPEGTAYTRQ